MSRVGSVPDRSHPSSPHGAHVGKEGNAGPNRRLSAGHALELALIGAGYRSAVRQRSLWSDDRGGAIDKQALRHGIPVEVQAGALAIGETSLAEGLAPQVRSQILKGMRLLPQLKAIQDVLKAADVPFLVFKGAPTAAVSRVEPLGRPSSDIDILVVASDVLRAHRALNAAGARLLPRFPTPREDTRYRLYQRFRQEMTYSFLGTHVDLHWQVGYARRSLPASEAAIRRSVLVDFAGLAIRTLAPPDALTHAVLHWRYGSFSQFKYVLDILGLQMWARRTAGAVSGQRASVASGIALANGLTRDPTCFVTGIRPPESAKSTGGLPRMDGLPSRPHEITPRVSDGAS